MDTLTIIIFAQAALDLVLLIVFFVMAYNVAKIRKVVDVDQHIPWDNNAYFDPVEEEIALGNKEKARELLDRLEFRYRRCLDRKADEVPGKSGLFVVKGGAVTEKEFVEKCLDRDVRALRERLK